MHCFLFDFSVFYLLRCLAKMHFCKATHQHQAIKCTAFSEIILCGYSFDFDLVMPFLFLFAHFSLFLLGNKKKYQKGTKKQGTEEKRKCFVKKTHVFYICFFTLSKKTKNNKKKNRNLQKLIKRTMTGQLYG